MFFMHTLLLLVLAIGAIGRAAITPLASSVGTLENVKTGLLLDIASVQNGSPIVVSKYTGFKLSQHWNLTQRNTGVGVLYDLNNTGSNRLAFVNPAAGNGLTARPLSTLFSFIPSTLPNTFSIVPPFTKLAVTSPDKAGEQVTLQKYNATDPSQIWFLFNV